MTNEQYYDMKLPYQDALNLQELFKKITGYVW